MNSNSSRTANHNRLGSTQNSNRPGESGPNSTIKSRLQVQMQSNLSNNSSSLDATKQQLFTQHQPGHYMSSPTSQNYREHYQTMPGYYTKGNTIYSDLQQEQLSPQAYSARKDPSGYYEGGTFLQIEEILNSNAEWINIQHVVRLTFKQFLDLHLEQQAQLQSLQEQISGKLTRSDLNSALVHKADIEDVSKAVTEVVAAVDNKSEIEELKKQLQSKMNRQEALSQYKAHQSMIDDLRKTECDLKGLINECTIEDQSLKERLDDAKKDQNKKLSQIYRELEKLGQQMERKVALEDFNERIDSKAEKLMVINALSSKVNKGEVEQAVIGKADIKEVDKLLMALEVKFEQEFTSIHDMVNRKANVDDYQYYRKELGFKLDKSELESFREEYVERLAAFDLKLSEKNQLMQTFRDALESKLETQLSGLKHDLHSKLEGKSETNDVHLLKQDVLLQLQKVTESIHGVKAEQHAKNEGINDKINRIHQENHDKIDRAQQEIDAGQSDIAKLKEQMKFIIKERQEDVSQISNLLKNSQKKTMADVLRVEKEVSGSVIQLKKEMQAKVQEAIQELEIKIEGEIGDKVKVEEVQDALRRLTESNSHKLESVYQDLLRLVNSKSDDMYSGLQKLKTECNEVAALAKTRVSQDQMQVILTQVEHLSRDLSGKSDKKNAQSQLDFLNENLISLNKEMLMKATMKDVLSLIDKKANHDEVLLDVNYLKNTLQKHVKEYRQVKDEQNSVNEALCSENCVARWIWKNGALDSSNGLPSSVKWDLQSVNTCPENFNWKAGQSYLQVDAPGLYEVTLAFFSKKKKPLVQILANREVVVQTVAKSACSSCGSSTQVQANGHVQKLASSASGTLYKVSLIEFVTLPAKAVVTVCFTHVQKSGGMDGSSSVGSMVNAEGFLGLRKL